MMKGRFRVLDLGEPIFRDDVIYPYDEGAMKVI